MQFWTPTGVYPEPSRRAGVTALMTFYEAVKNKFLKIPDEAVRQPASAPLGDGVAIPGESIFRHFDPFDGPFGPELTVEGLREKS
jgi:hypothetical protein